MFRGVKMRLPLRTRPRTARASGLTAGQLAAPPRALLPRSRAPARWQRPPTPPLRGLLLPTLCAARWKCVVLTASGSKFGRPSVQSRIWGRRGPNPSAAAITSDLPQKEQRSPTTHRVTARTPATRAWHPRSCTGNGPAAPSPPAARGQTTDGRRAGSSGGAGNRTPSMCLPNTQHLPQLLEKPESPRKPHAGNARRARWPAGGGLLQGRRGGAPVSGAARGARRAAHHRPPCIMCIGTPPIIAIGTPPPIAAPGPPPPSACGPPPPFIAGAPPAARHLLLGDTRIARPPKGPSSAAPFSRAIAAGAACGAAALKVTKP
ncbi:MAG: hypothetical protein J3K34DRAFT_158523 [Monoraphidium minutum]|nr:MAG: hypothetical protein J3K34DRAFT_158523 [Monoraphidium minutum]